MHLWLLIWLFLSAVSNALGFTPPDFIKGRLRRRRVIAPPLHMGWFDFKPMHGSGSGGDDDALDEQWEAQQAILRARQGHLTKDALKNKYRGVRDKPVVLDQAPPKAVGHQADGDTTKISVDKEENSQSSSTSLPSIKFPWDK